jgi:hypothetical protein
MKYHAHFLAALICLCAVEKSDAATPMVTIPNFYWDTALQPQNHDNGMVGWTFFVARPVTVTQVGWYDHGGDGLSRPFQVGLWQDLSGGVFSPSATLKQLLGDASSGMIIPGGTAAALQGVWRVVDLPSALVLQAGSYYQIAGLDTAETPDVINYLWEYGTAFTNDDVYVSYFFDATRSSSQPGFHAVDYNHFAMAAGMNLGPMLFTVPEPSGLLLTAAGAGLLLVMRRR